MSTAINAVSAVSMKAAAVCQTIHDLIGTHTSDPATWPDYGVKSLVRSPQCSLKPDDIADTMIENLRHNVGEQKKRLCSISRDSAPKGSDVQRNRWTIHWSKLSGVWVAMPAFGVVMIDGDWSQLVRRVNAEVARRKRSTDLGR